MSSNTILKPLIFEKNIGVTTVPKVTDFPSEIFFSPKIPEFHFILAFVEEERKRNGKGKGKFSPSWNVKDFSAEKIIKLKSEYENVKVVISIGGGGANYPFNPEDKEKWIDNAKKSLEKIIEHDYKSSTTKIVIDGIDITYERIESDDFVECMAEVMKYLKMKGLKVSIALSSFPTDPLDRVFSIHKNLYEGNKDLIDWVDYNLYSQTMSTTHYSLSQSDSFCVRRILAGFSTDPNNTGNIPLDVFLKNCRKPKIQSLPIKKCGVQLVSSSNFRTPQVPKSKPQVSASKPRNQPANPLNSKSHDHLAETTKLPLTSSFIPPNRQIPSKPQVPASKPKTQGTLASKPGNQPLKRQPTSSLMPKNQQAASPKPRNQPLTRQPTSSLMPKNRQTASPKPGNQSIQPRQSTSVYNPKRQLTPSFTPPNRSTLISNSRYHGQSPSASNSRILSATPASELGVQRARASKPGIRHTHPSNHIIPLAPKLGIKQTHAPKSGILPTHAPKSGSLPTLASKPRI